jgi:hypothetical protein
MTRIAEIIWALWVSASQGFVYHRCVGHMPRSQSRLPSCWIKVTDLFTPKDATQFVSNDRIGFAFRKGSLNNMTPISVFLEY